VTSEPIEALYTTADGNENDAGEVLRRKDIVAACNMEVSVMITEPRYEISLRSFVTDRVIQLCYLQSSSRF
jgi:hypothetical protein